MHRYSSIAARHYAAYRPPLHRPIVQAALDKMRFSNALDVGCGVGHSCEALLPFCDRVIGIDPSPQMICSARNHRRISYHLGSGADLPDCDDIDCVSVAGALPYMDKAGFVDQLKRVCTPSAVVLIYDFKVELDDILSALHLPAASPESRYNHATNLSDTAGIETLKTGCRRISFLAKPEELAHLLMTNEARVRRLADHFGQDDPKDALTQATAALAPLFELRAMTWTARHRMI
ncbi:MAG: class I SAM-dependent methyltransferase [Pseudomonadota bacterium]